LTGSKNGSKRFLELMKNDDWRNEQRKKQSIGTKKALIRKKISGFWIGKKHKEESKSKIGLFNSIAQKGENNCQYGTHWITNGIENKKIKKNDVFPDDWKYGRTVKK
jgi:hypothetical protein